MCFFIVLSFSGGDTLETLIDRIILIRKEFGLNQDEFAQKLQLTRNYISLVETGKRTPSDRTIRDICSVFAISEDWLRYGTEPKRKPIDDKLSAYVSEITDGDDEFIRNFIETYMELDNDSRAVLREFSKKMAEKYK